MIGLCCKGGFFLSLFVRVIGLRGVGTCVAFWCGLICQRRCGGFHVYLLSTVCVCVRVCVHACACVCVCGIRSNALVLRCNRSHILRGTRTGSSMLRGAWLTCPCVV